MRARVTITDVALHLGISKASVSYALNDRPGVSPQTRRRVLEAAAELGWHPSSSARALSRAKTGAIGLILSRDPGIIGTEPYYMRLISGIESALVDADMELILRVVGSGHGRDLGVYEKWAGEGRVDGVILCDLREDDPRLPLVHRLGMPAVLAGGPVPGSSVPCVVSDEPTDAARVVDHLHGLGHEVVMHVAGPAELVHERRRRQALRESAAEVGMVIETVESDYTAEGGRRAVARRLARASAPTAMVFGNDLMALGGLVAARAAGVEVPRQLSVVSWDDSMLCQLASPQVTALDRDPGEHGRLSAMMLLEVIGGGDPPGMVTPASALIVRASTSSAPSPSLRGI